MLPPNMIPFEWIDEDRKFEAIQNRTIFTKYEFNYQFHLIERLDSDVISGNIYNRGTFPQSLNAITTNLVFFIDYFERKPVYITFDNISLYLLTEIHNYQNNKPLNFFFRKISNLSPISKGIAFMIMPFKLPELNDLYRVHVKEFLKNEFHLDIFRADDFNGNDIIIETIYKQIGQAEIIIAETTYSNKNVFYELGYASALKKEILMIQNKSIQSDTFFDKAHIRTQRYDPLDLDNFKAELKNNIIAIRDKYSHL